MAASDSTTANENELVSVFSSENSTELVNGELIADKETKTAGAKKIDHILKALNSLDTPEEKLAALCSKYTELFDLNNRSQHQLKQSQKKMQILIKEREHSQSEHTKAMIAKTKLESLCREMQNQNRAIKAESLQREKDDDEKRRQLSNKFQKSIGDIQTQMTQHSESNQKLQTDNIELTTKMKQLLEQYEQREQHIEKILKHRDIEGQLAAAKLEQAKIQYQELVERHTADQLAFKENTLLWTKRIELKEAEEKHLRQQLAVYTEKYGEFESTLHKSNELLAKFKRESEQMTKKMRRLEKESANWRQRYDEANSMVLALTFEKEKLASENALLGTKQKRLESLCRTLTNERKGITAAASCAPPAKSDDALTSSGGSDSTTDSSTAAAEDPQQPPVNPAPEAVPPTGEAADEVAAVSVTASNEVDLHRDEDATVDAANTIPSAASSFVAMDTNTALDANTILDTNAALDIVTDQLTSAAIGVSAPPDGSPQSDNLDCVSDSAPSSNVDSGFVADTASETHSEANVEPLLSVTNSV